MDALELFRKFEAKVMADPKTYYADYLRVKEQVDNSTAIYRGKPVDFLYQPMFFTETDIDRFRALTATLRQILRKVTDEYKRSPRFRKLFGFSPLMEELILVDPGYDYYFPMARFDLFYPFSDNFKFCELNADGSSSMNESTVLRDIFFASKALDGITDRYEVYDFELLDSWVDSMISNYETFTGETDPKPNIAIVDFDGEGIISEFEVFQSHFQARGYDTVICDPRKLRYRNGELTYNGKRIDLVYRRAVTARLVEEAEHIQDFLQAYRDGAVCVVGGLVSQVIHNKIIFAVLHSDQCLSLLEPDEREFVKKHIPYTAVFEPGDEKLREEVKKSKDKWVLKPLDQYAGRGVYIGQDFTEEKWQELVDDIKAGTYMAQEFCSVPQINMATVENESIHFEKYNYQIGLFLYNEEFAGFYTRAGRTRVIAPTAESFDLPNFVVVESE